MEQPNGQQEHVIDLSSARGRSMEPEVSARSGLSRPAIGAVPPWRTEGRTAIVDRPDRLHSHVHLIEPARLRRSLFEADMGRLIPNAAESEPMVAKGSDEQQHRRRRFMKRR